MTSAGHVLQNWTQMLHTSMRFYPGQNKADSQYYPNHSNLFKTVKITAKHTVIILHFDYYDIYYVALQRGHVFM